MKRVLVAALLGLLAWQGYARYQAAPARNADVAKNAQSRTVPRAPVHGEEFPTPLFECDGRTRCTQMTSCAEATFFLQNCPAVKVDADGDGVPCEQQWCGG
ncbi:MAG: excalibur calcium-binding domain-containing protein [Lysobacterales bacterium]